MPFIQHVTGSKLEAIEEYEIKENGLGMGQLVIRSNEENDESSEDDENELERIQREFGDVEVRYWFVIKYFMFVHSVEFSYFKR